MNAEILRFTTPDDLYRSLLGRLVRELESLQATSHGPVLALPTGNTMIPFYELMVKNQNLLLPESWTCFQLDEYYPIPASKEPLGFRNYLDRHLFSKLLTPPRCREHPDGGAEDADLECARYEARIREVGGIDLAILGIGTNGHIAFNEPGSPHHSRTRRVELHPDTLQANFGSDAPFHHAITLGIETLLEARKILVVALGESKATAVRNALLGPICPEMPASALQKHPSVTWFLDSSAASGIPAGF